MEIAEYKKGDRFRLVNRKIDRYREFVLEFIEYEDDQCGYFKFTSPEDRAGDTCHMYLSDVKKLPPPAPFAGDVCKYVHLPNPDRWQPGISLGVFDGVEWFITKKIKETEPGKEWFVKNDEGEEASNNVWFSCLVYSAEELPPWSKYWLSWNGVRFAKTVYPAILEAYRPDLYNVVLNKLKEINK